MLSHGDEMGRTQRGNNNAYCQDNALSWLDWNLDPRSANCSSLPDECSRSAPRIRCSAAAATSVMSESVPPAERDLGGSGRTAAR